MEAEFRTKQIQFERVHAEFYKASESLEEVTEQMEETQTSLNNLQHAREIIQEIASTIQTLVHANVSTIVSRCLEIVFPDPYSCRIDFHKKRNKTEATIVLCKDGQEFDPMSDVSGGVQDVVAFGLRIAAMVLSSPPVRRILIADEPFKWVSKGRRKGVQAMLLKFAEELGFQFIIVTHMPELVVEEIKEHDAYVQGSWFPESSDYDFEEDCPE